MNIMTANSEGHYSYMYEGQPSGIIESYYSRYLTKEKQTLFHCIRDGRNSSYQTFLELKAQLSPNLQEGFGTLTLRDKSHSKNVQFKLTANAYQVSTQGKTSSHPLNSKVIFYPLMRIFTGPVIHCIRRQQKADIKVLVPRLTQTEDPQLFRPEISIRTVTLLQDFPEHSVWHFVGGPYDESATFTTNKANHILRSYQHAGWQVIHRPVNHSQNAQKPS